MDASRPVEISVALIAATIGEPARARMLYSLLDGHARTSSELAAVGAVSPSTASVHLSRLKEGHLVKVVAQGKHRYYRLADATVANALGALAALAGGSHPTFVPNTPQRLRSARTCYDHMAGRVAVLLHDRFEELGWLSAGAAGAGDYHLSKDGVSALSALGIDVTGIQLLRRRFAYPCVDWSERRPHIGGALGAALLQATMRRKWVKRDSDGRGLDLTAAGRREMRGRFGLTW